MKRFLAILLTLVLTLSFSSAALAAEATGDQTGFTNNSGDTKVTVEVNAGNLSVTVPISMTIVAPVAGGACATPTNYSIVNKSALAIKVVGIQVTDTASGLTFSDTAPSATVNDKDKVSIALTPASGSKIQLTTTKITTGLGGFDIAAATDATGTSLAIAIEAYSGMLSSTAGEADAFKITFTVEAGTTTT